MKNLLNLGKVLSRAQQKEVFGGSLQENICFGGSACVTDADCCVEGATCVQDVNTTSGGVGGGTYYNGSMVCSI